MVPADRATAHRQRSELEVDPAALVGPVLRHDGIRSEKGSTPEQDAAAPTGLVTGEGYAHEGEITSATGADAPAEGRPVLQDHAVAQMDVRLPDRQASSGLPDFGVDAATLQGDTFDVNRRPVAVLFTAKHIHHPVEATRGDDGAVSARSGKVQIVEDCQLTSAVTPPSTTHERQPVGPSGQGDVIIPR